MTQYRWWSVLSVGLWMEKRFLELCDGYRHVSFDEKKLDIPTLWSFILPQVRVLFHYDENEQLYEFFFQQLATSGVSIMNKWSLLLSSAILIEHYFHIPHYQIKFLNDYRSYLCGDFVTSTDSLIEVHYFITKTILEKMTPESFVFFFSPIIDHLLSAIDDQLQLSSWLYKTFGGGAIEPRNWDNVCEF